MGRRREFLVSLSALGLEPPAGANRQGTIYIPERQVETDRAQILDFVEEYSFAMLVTAQGGLHISNVPTLLERAKEGWGKLWWHIAKANAQNQALEGGECTMVFHGPHGYISPNWYKAKTAVPTWNFAVVHATGRPKRIEDDAAVAAGLARLVARNEGEYAGGGGWEYSKLPEPYLKGMRQAIVAYEMEIERVEAKFKLGQDRSAEDRAGILNGLRTGRKERGLAELTAAYYSRIKP